MQITTAKLRPLHKNWQIDFATSGKVLDVTIATVLGPTWNGSCALFTNLFLKLGWCTSSVDALRLRGLRDDALQTGRFDEVGFSAVPFSKDFMGRSTAKDARMNETGKANPWNVSGGTEDAFKVPYCLRTGTNVSVASQARSQPPYASGYMSSRKPPPLSLWKMPVNPHGCSWNGWTS